MNDEPAPAEAARRTDYRCTALGCPNMGTLGGAFGVNRSGTCRWHHGVDASRWGEVTHAILADPSKRDEARARPSHAEPGYRDTIGQRAMREAAMRKLHPTSEDEVAAQ